jgi:hypothetical protein
MKKEMTENFKQMSKDYTAKNSGTFENLIHLKIADFVKRVEFEKKIEKKIKLDLENVVGCKCHEKIPQIEPVIE